MSDRYKVSFGIDSGVIARNIVNGDLIGINSAISSNTGYYQGYGFAVPSNLAKKIVEDIKKFGLVQRGFLGVVSLDLSDDRQVAAYNQSQKANIKASSGIMITEITENRSSILLGITLLRVQWQIGRAHV